MNTLKKLVHGISVVIEIMTVICFIILFLLVLLQMFGRYFGVNGIGWTDEMISCFTTWMAMLGASYLVERKWHVQVTMLLDKMNGMAKKLMLLLLEVLNMLCGLGIAYSGWIWIASNNGKITAILQIQYNLWYTSICVFGCAFALFSAVHLLDSFFGLFKKAEAN